MTDQVPITASFEASDGYPIHTATWSVEGTPRGRVVILHGVQSHGGWYHGLGRRLAAKGFEAHFPDRRGSGANRQERGHAPSHRRLLDDLNENLARLPREAPVVLAGISWGGKLAVLGAAENPERVAGLALICPGLHPRVGVSLGERIRIATAMLTGRSARATFPIPLNDPALFTDSPAGQAFIASDPLGLRVGTAGLMAASYFIDRDVAAAPGRVRQPTLLMLAGRDRIVDNERTRAYFRRLAAPDKTLIEYPEGHHTLEFDPDPGRYADDLAAWIDRTLAG